MNRKSHTIGEADITAMAQCFGRPVPDVLKAKIFEKVRGLEESKAIPDKAKTKTKGRERGRG